MNPPPAKLLINTDHGKKPGWVKGWIVLFIAILILLLVSPGWAVDPAAATPNFLPVMFQHWPTATATPQPGFLLISEVLYDPDGLEPGGEWVEIFNAGGTDVDLSLYKLGDEETLGGPEGMYQFPAGAVLLPGEAIVVANQAVAYYALFRLLPDYELHESHPFIPNLVKYPPWSGGSVELSNGGDEVLLLDQYDQRVDGISWGSSRAVLDPPLPVIRQGHSYERKPAYRDTDSAGDWIDQEVPTPGKVDLSLPTATPTTPVGGTATPEGPLSLLISEVFYDPLGSDPDGEWIELYNYSGSSASLDGLRVGDEETQGGGEGMLAFPSGWHIAAGQAIVIANRAGVFSDTFGSLPDFEIYDSHASVPDMLRDTGWGSGAVNLGNGGDEVLLLDWQSSQLDALSWGSSSYAFDPAVPAVAEGHSLERYPPSADTDSASDWRDQPAPRPGEVDLTAPTPTTQPPPVAGVVINEIHADPHAVLGDANGDGLVSSSQDEFIEIVNNFGSTIDLSGWQIFDSVGLRHTFPPGSVLTSNCAVLVFGGGVPAGGFGGSLVQTASSGSLGLNNDGDGLTLKNDSGAAAATYSYGNEAGDDQSLTRSPDITGSEPLVKHTLAAGSAGALFSPGTQVDGAAFPGCTIIFQ